MPKEKIIREYSYPPDLPPEERTPDKAKITERKVPVSDEQTFLDELTEECTRTHSDVIRLVSKWNKVSPVEKDTLLELLVKFYIVVGERLRLFSITEEETRRTK